MLANRDPIYIQTPRRGVFRLTVANTAKDGTGTINPLFTATAAASKGGGSIVEYISAISEATIPAATAIRFFISDTSGVNFRFYMEIAIPAFVASGTVPGWTTGNLLTEVAATNASMKSPRIPVNIRLDPGQVLGVTCQTTDVIDVHADGGDL